MAAEKFTDAYPLAEKEVKLYEAVCELLTEGKDAGALKVSVITERAGIGKGTAYEYFKSKDEMIARAMHYSVAKSFWEIEKRTEHLPTIQEKYLTVLDWLEEIFYGTGSMSMIWQVVRECLHTSNSFRGEWGKCGQESNYIFRRLDEMVARARENGFLPLTVPAVVQSTMIMSNFAAFWISLNRDPKMSGEERKTLKNHLLKCLEQNLLLSSS